MATRNMKQINTGYIEGVKRFIVSNYTRVKSVYESSMNPQKIQVCSYFDFARSYDSLYRVIISDEGLSTVSMFLE